MLRVAAYCRVSSDKDDQANSYESQKLYFEQKIKENEDWTLVDIYADKGISGTNTNKRADFNRMMKDALNGKIDIILTKEVSRFSRNVEELLSDAQKLRNTGVYIWFLSDDIYTEKDDYREELSKAASERAYFKNTV